MYYLFVINDLNFTYETLSAEEIIKRLFENKCWLYTSSTPNIKRIKPGDKVIIYMAGKGRRFFRASFELETEVKRNTLKPKDEIEEMLYNHFSFMSEIKNVCFWNKPVPIKEIKADLKFITDKINYGLFFRSATRRLSKDDYKLIIKTKNALND